MKKKVDVLFIPNGNTSITENGEQVTELQKPWIIEYAKYLEKNDVDIFNSIFEVVEYGEWRKIKLFKKENDEIGWEFIS